MDRVLSIPTDSMLSECVASGDEFVGVDAPPPPPHPTIEKRLKTPASPVSCGTMRAMRVVALAWP